MTWIPMICLLAISSSAFGRSISYQEYGTAQPQVLVMDLVYDLPQQQLQVGVQTQQEDLRIQAVFQQQPIQNGSGSSYGPQETVSKPLIQADLGYGKSQMNLQQQQLQPNIQESTLITDADRLCRGQRSETVIPLDNGHRFVACLDDGKGSEQPCPKGLYYRNESRRCEPKLDPVENLCSSRPCLNGGLCVPDDISSYKCQCALSFDGKTCELDATVCQTEQPCGQSQDAKCQSFHWGAALQHICILQDGRAYGPTDSQAHPSPCNGVDGTFPLVFSDKGFIMCDGKSMDVESCPGGTVWDDLGKACTWPDMIEVTSPDEKKSGLQSFGQSINSTQYNGSGQMKTPSSQILPQQKTLQLVQPQRDRLSTYGSQQQIQLTVQQPLRVLQQDRLDQQQLQVSHTYSYGSQQSLVKFQILQQPVQNEQDFVRSVPVQEKQQSFGY